MFSCKYCKNFMNSFFYRKPLVAASQKYEYTVYMLDLLKELLCTFFDWKTSKWAYHLLQFFISYWARFLKLIKFITLSYLSLLNLLLFLSKFSVALNDYLFRWLAYKSPLSRFLVSINYITWSYNLFFYIQRFSWSRFFWVQVSQGPSPGSGIKI